MEHGSLWEQYVHSMLLTVSAMLWLFLNVIQ